MLIAVQAGGNVVVVYPSAPTTGEVVKDEDDDETEVDTRLLDLDKDNTELLLVTTALLEIVLAEIEVPVTDAGLDEVVSVDDAEAIPMYLAPRIPPLLIDAPRVFFM